jgi:asparagine synthase (glutamine-hydrolysing)
MQAQSHRPVKTFTVGFHEANYDEARHAKQVAKYLGTDHTEIYISPKEAISVVPKLPIIYDEPFADSSQIPTFFVASLARSQVTVSLSGDGGDELFGGYTRYALAQSVWNRLRWTPPAVRKAIARCLTGLEPQTWERGFGWLARALRRQNWEGRVGDRLHKLAKLFHAKAPDETYVRLVSHWNEPEQLVLGAREPATLLTDSRQWPSLSEFLHRLMFFDSAMYLPDDILVKVDRMSMAVSLESRIPLLDHRVIEFAWRLPLNMKFRHGQGKWLLRQLLYKYIPRSLIERPKMGFGIPLDEWLRGPLRGWAEDLLIPDRIKREGFLDAERVAEKWREHLSGNRNWQYHLWDVLMFEAWIAEQRTGLN